MEEKKCPICGATNDADAKFCVGCANEFKAEELVEAVTEAVEEQVTEIEEVAEVVEEQVNKLEEAEPIVGEYVEGGVQTTEKAVEQVKEEAKELVEKPVEQVAEVVKEEATQVQDTVTETVGTVAAIPVLSKKEQKKQDKEAKKNEKVQKNSKTDVPASNEAIASNGGYVQKPLSVIGWMALMLLRIIPLGGIIQLIIALTSSNPTLRNYGKARLIWIIIFVILFIVGFFMLLPLIQDGYGEVMDIIDTYR